MTAPWPIGINAARRSPKPARGGGVRTTLATAAALLVVPAATGEEDGQNAQELEPERIDVVFSRLARQDRTLDTLLEIVRKLEQVAQHPDAAAALLSDEGEPTDRLRSALVEVAQQRDRPPDPPAVPVVVDAGSRPAEALRPEIVYAQMTPGDAPRVLVSVRGARFAAVAGRAIRLGEDTIKVLEVRRGSDAAGVEVELSINGGAPFVRRARW